MLENVLKSLQKLGHVIDSTKLKDYCMCPRYYLYKYILQWLPDHHGVAFHAKYGVCVHKAMEVIQSCGYLEGCSPKACAEFTHWFDYFNLEETGYKTVQNAHCAINLHYREYAEFYCKCKFLHIEVPGMINVNNETNLYFRLDAVMITPDNKIYVVDHKTTGKRMSSWEESFDIDIQSSIYLHALHCLVTEKMGYIGGMMINGFFFGTAMPTVTRHIVNKPESYLYLLLEHIYDTITEIRIESQKLSEWIENNTEELINTTILKLFRPNYTSCFKYGRCQYYNMCTTYEWGNPLSRCEYPALGFVVSEWDPRVEELEGSKKPIVDVNYNQKEGARITNE
jgi:hypothetical protein